jgi:hypothetical protein
VLPGDALLASFVVSKPTGVIFAWGVFCSKAMGVGLGAGVDVFFMGIASRQQAQRRSAAQMPIPI